MITRLHINPMHHPQATRQWRRSCAHAASRRSVACPAPQSHAHSDVDRTRRFRCYSNDPIRLNSRTGVDSTGRLYERRAEFYTPDGKPSAWESTWVLSEVEGIWERLEARLAAGDATSWRGMEEFQQLFRLEHEDADLLAWHVLPRLRPYLADVGGPIEEDVITAFVRGRCVDRGDFTPLVWALGLGVVDPIMPSKASPLPAQAEPPMSMEAKARLLNAVVEQVAESCTEMPRPERSFLAPAINGLMEGLCGVLVALEEQQQQEVLKGFPCLLQLWQVGVSGGDAPSFWQLLRDVPVLQRAAPGLVRHVQAHEVRVFYQGLVSLGLLHRCNPGDIWWLVALLDQGTGDGSKVLGVFKELAMLYPHHPAFDSLGTLLLQCAERHAVLGQPPAPERILGGIYCGYTEYLRPDVQQLMGQMEAVVDETSRMEFVNTQLIPQLACRVSGSEIVEWLQQLQEVWSPQASYDLLLQLLLAPDQHGRFTAADRLQLYDLLLWQVARPGWPPAHWVEIEDGEWEEWEQPLGSRLPPAAADIVLSALSEGGTKEPDAGQVLVVWRHVCATVQPHWFDVSEVLEASWLECVGIVVTEKIREAQEVVASHGDQDEWEAEGPHDAAYCEIELDQWATGIPWPARHPASPAEAPIRSWQQLYSALSSTSQQQVRQAMEKLGLPFEVGSMEAAEGQAGPPEEA